MTGKDIFKALGGLDPKIVLSAAPQEETGVAKVKTSSNMWIKLGALAAAIIVLILAVPLIADLLPSGDGGYVADSYSEVFDQCDLAVFGTYKGKTEKLTYSEYTFEVNDVLKGEVTKKEIAVRSEKKSIFSEDEMEKHSQEASVGFKEGEEYFLALKSSSKGVIDFISQQIISINDIESGSVSADFGAFLEENGISIDITREDLKNFFEYIFGGASYPNEDTKPDPEPQGTEGIIYELAEDGASYVVKGYNIGIDPEVVIPARYNGLPVTEIGDRGFYEARITSVSIPGSVTRIGESAFDGCMSLITVNIEKGVTVIEDSAFTYCFELSEIALPDGVTSIGNSVFRLCRNLEKISIPDSITHIGGAVFGECDKLRYNEYGGGKYLGNEDNPYAVFVRVSSSDVTSLKLHSATVMIGTSAFSNQIKELTIPYNVRVIDDRAFSGSYIKNIVLPDSVVRIGDGAFSNCAVLEQVYIPAGVETIGQSIFSNSGNIKTITVDEKNEKYYSEGKCIISKGDKIIISGTANSVIPTDVVGIGDYAFANTGFARSKFTIPSHIKSVGARAFLGNNLYELTVPGGVVIGEYAFSRCSNLTSVTFQEDAKEISSGMFSECSSLKSISIPGTIEVIGDRAFSACTKLESVVLSHGIKSIGEEAFYWCRALKKIKIHASVTELGERVFEECDGLTEAEILCTEASLCGTFLGCDYLKTVTFSDGLKAIGENAFSGCWSLKSVKIPESVEKIGEKAFYNCLSIEKITIPAGVTMIGSSAFEECDGLIEAEVLCAEDSLVRTFYGCDRLSKITLSEGLTGIGQYAFADCINLKSVTIPGTVKVIGMSAFNNCNRLASVFIPTSVERIEYYAFGYCNVLNSIEYGGTMASWNEIVKQNDWNNRSSAIVCTDGTITK